MLRSLVILICYNLFVASSFVLSIELNQNEIFKRELENHRDDSFSLKNSSAIDLNLLLDVWNPKLMYHLWTTTKRENLNNISSLCERDISCYLNGFIKGYLWALKMNDASGHYTSGFFSGNKFWIGAIDQCREMQNEFTFNSPFDNQNQTTVNVNNLLPFAIDVFSVNLEIHLFEFELINHSPQITLGLCLPATCHTDDVIELLKFYIDNTSKDSNNINNIHNNGGKKNITVNYVRNLSEGYSVWEDSTFYIILGFTTFILLFILLGTCYDIALRYKYLDKLNAQSKSDASGDMNHRKNAETQENCNTSISGDRMSTIAKLWTMKDHNGSIDIHNANSVPKPMSEALLAFSLLLNLSKVFNFDVGHDTLAPIHGLRFISMLWVILVHTCLLTNEISDNNLFRLKAERNFLYQTISNGNYSVDTFFFISGCLVAYIYFQTMSKHKLSEANITKGNIGKLYQFIGMIIYRYFRLTPPYLLVIGIIQISTKWNHDHYMIPLTTLEYQTCEKYWWRNALYINTYFNMDERCMTWSWYLANDTQFYTFGIIILITGGSFFKIGAFIGGITLLASWIVTAIITLETEHIPTIENPFDHYESLYDKPWTRIGPYLIGMATGWYLHNIECKLKINKIILIIGWSLSIVTLLSIVYGLYGNNFGLISSAMYTALSHSGWAISIAWILISSVTSNGGIVGKILSWKYIYPLSRLTYCAYLIHPVLTRAIILRGESTLHLSQELIVSKI
ncbi:hypothetical protein PV325_008321 [Microctonus aethiopoides]|nr:hypothetical protein PV325_008321 [Microctonus aethiopoides]